MIGVLKDRIIKEFPRFSIPKEGKQNDEWWQKSFGYHKVLMPILLVISVVNICINTYYNGFNMLVMDSPIHTTQHYIFYLNGPFFLAWMLFELLFPIRKRSSRFDKQAILHHIVASTMTVSVFFIGGGYSEFAISLLLAETATYVDLIFPKRYQLKLYIAVFKAIGLTILIAHLDIGFLLVQKDYPHSTASYIGMGIGLTTCQLILVFHFWLLRHQVLKMKKYKRKTVQLQEAQ